MSRSLRILAALALLTISTVALGAQIPIANNTRFAATATISSASMKVLTTMDLAGGAQFVFDIATDVVYYVTFRPATGGTPSLAGIYNAMSVTYEGNGVIDVAGPRHAPQQGCYSGTVVTMVGAGNAIASWGQLYLLAGEVPPKGKACVCGTLYTATGALSLVYVTSNCSKD